MSLDDLDDTGMDGSVVVDEALLNAVRAEASRAPSDQGEAADGAPADDGTADDGTADGAIARGIPGETTESGGRPPTIEGYGALREIGRGGFSHVYEALQFEFERWVAVKVLNDVLEDAEAAEDFERECRAMGGLSGHPNIVTVFSSAFTSDGRPCVVMELFPHGSYLDILLRAGPLGLDQLLPVSVRIAGALATAHNRGMVHGDVKPQNIFRSQYELAALGDFGISTLISQSWRAQKTRMSMYYAAPEIIERGSVAASPFSDQYSLGATIYTLATGHRPFEGRAGETTRELLVRTLSEDPPRLGAGFPPSLDEALHKAMSRKLQDRHGDLVEFGTALTATEDEIGLASTNLRVGSDAGRYTGGAIDLELSRSRSLERSGDRSRSAARPSASTSDAGTRPGDTAPAGEASSERDGGPPPEATVVRPGRAARAEAPRGSAPAKGPRRRRWMLVVAPVVLIAAGVGALALSGIITLPGAGGDSDTAEAVSEPAAPQPELEPAPEPPEPAPEPEPVVLPEPPAEPPGAIGPDSIDVDPKRDGLVVTWDEPAGSGSSILLYRVQWTGAGDSFMGEREVLVDSARALIGGLDSDTEYRLRVAAENEHGRGEWAEFGGRTLPEGVPSPPELEITPVEGRLAVTWSALGDEERPITRYYLEWEGPDGRITREEYSADVSGAEILDPVRGQTYLVGIAAENEHGRGEWTRQALTVPYTPPEPPGALAVREHYRRLEVSWGEPDDDGGSAVTGYRAELHSGGEMQQFRSVPPDTFTADFRRLDSGRSYEVRLFAENEAGLSDAAQAHGFSLYRIAVVSDAEGVDAIYYADVSGRDGFLLPGDLIRITDAGRRTREGRPSWSPDGLWVAFERRHPDGSHWQIWIKNIESGEEHQLVCGRANGWSPAWSPDGRSIAFARGDRGNDLWMIDVKTGDQRSLKDRFDADDAYPSWSPDGDAIVFARRDHDPRRGSWYNSRNPREIRVLTGVSSEATALPVERLTNYAAGNYSAPDWSHDGALIAFAVSETGSTSRHITVMDADGNLLWQLTQEPVDDDPSWSPDGEWVAFARGTDGARDVYALRTADGELMPLLVDGAIDYWAPSWAPSSAVSVSPEFDCGA